MPRRLHAAPIAASASGRVPLLSGGHGRPEVRPSGRLGTLQLCPRRPKPAGATDGPAGEKRAITKTGR
ncbi:MAG: hypothetical protein ACKONH_00460, partial [Planctomycetia bacterium]